MADKAFVDVPNVTKVLSKFFKTKKKDVSKFGSTVNQVFEAFVFASTISWYGNKGWNVQIKHPKKLEEEEGKGLKPSLRLKFTTRGRPANYSYALCTKDGCAIQVRHQMRVLTKFHQTGNKFSANVCLDIAVILDKDLSEFKTSNAVSNDQLITFGEAKHMSAFAELVAGFIGLVHEMQPERLSDIRLVGWKRDDQAHPPPFMYVSGVLYHTAEGILETIQNRHYDLDVYTKTTALVAKLSQPQSVTTHIAEKPPEDDIPF